MEKAGKPLGGRTVILAARGRSTLTLNDLAAPVLVRAGARLVRYCHAAEPGSMEFAAGYRPLDRKTLSQRNPAIIMTMDDYDMTWYADAPVVVLPHATFREPATPLVMTDDKATVFGCDFYFTQDDCTRYADIAPQHLIYTARNIETVTFVPLGSLKRDALARDLAASTRKDVIMVCGGHPDFPVPTWEETCHFLENLLKSHVRYSVVFRPFPDNVGEAVPVKDRFAGEKRFILDTSPSTRNYMARAAAVVCFASTTGEAYSMASGEPHVLVDTNQPDSLSLKDGAFVCGGVRSAMEALDILLDAQKNECGHVARLKEQVSRRIDSLIYRPGHAEEILLQTVLDITERRPPVRSLAVPAMPYEERKRRNMLEGFSRLESLLDRDDFFDLAENTAFSSFLLVSLYAVFRELLTSPGSGPRLIALDKSRLNQSKGFVTTIAADRVTAETLVLVAGERENFTYPALRWLENHPGGFLWPDGLPAPSQAPAGLSGNKPGNKAVLALAAMETARPVFLLQDVSKSALRDSWLTIMTVLRFLVNEKTRPPAA